jgi:hypothetical protein
MLAAPASPQAPAPAPEPLRPGDEAVLRDVDLLLEWELLQGWDPAENLPIPLPPEPAKAPEPE